MLEIDTNRVENIIRPTKLGMKKWMLFGSLEAWTNNALTYTQLANCRAKELDPENYPIEVLHRLPHDATKELASIFTPARIAAERRAALEADTAAAPANYNLSRHPTPTSHGARQATQFAGDNFRTLTEEPPPTHHSKSP